MFLFSILIILGACTNRKVVQEFPDLNKVQAHDDQAALSILSFGSCNRVDLEQPLWDDIVGEQSDAWLWLGDIIYGDTEDMAKMKAMYSEQKSKQGYKDLVAKTKIFGIWDDHDYGVNDGGKNYVKKKESRDILFEFLDVKPSNENWNHEGAYQSYTFGKTGQRIKLILLDTRYFKDPIRREKGVYIADKNADLLGSVQWTWLENELKEKADLFIIANGTQVLPKEHRFEKWANYPTERNRFLELLSQLEVKTILLSGDRHIGEISKFQFQNGREIMEVTSSGMTHSYRGNNSESNQYRIGEIVNNLNYGVLKISWQESIPTIQLELKGDQGKTYNQVTY